jgi:roadblock/LC7 domain-containing protein
MDLAGAQAAFGMNDRGELQEHVIAQGSALDSTSLDLLAHMCVANIAIATMQARGWEVHAGSSGFYPVTGFTLVGMDWSAVTNGRWGVVIANEAVDYEKAYAALDTLGGAA